MSYISRDGSNGDDAHDRSIVLPHEVDAQKDGIYPERWHTPSLGDRGV